MNRNNKVKYYLATILAIILALYLVNGISINGYTLSVNFNLSLFNLNNILEFSYLIPLIIIVMFIIGIYMVISK
jgi:hypothetical protein